ncbi:unnamed protein product [Vitrella brassicaformis CCMP3155]|uniref:Uncharacterized protein n=1 Tax=Vitrella brassicaformis (strain CCMP3155) TaxID=1169540 RepID=A0A0G4GFZ0_VITBC|nr:unnamed protein product [Vitrella brassicaformis CCMP3155]|eukprot:CEM28240.1 unnamed protein product [Vitrella brassicaformis CCMP3155]
MDTFTNGSRTLHNTSGRQLIDSSPLARPATEDSSVSQLRKVLVAVAVGLGKAASRLAPNQVAVSCNPSICVQALSSPSCACPWHVSAPEERSRLP